MFTTYQSYFFPSHLTSVLYTIKVPALHIQHTQLLLSNITTENNQALKKSLHFDYFLLCYI